MKKSILVILCAFFNVALIGMSSSPIPKFKINNQNPEQPVYYSLQLEGIFQKNDREKFENAFKSLSAPFVIDEIDYENKTIVIKMIEKVAFDNVKQCFDKVGLRIIKEKGIKK